MQMSKLFKKLPEVDLHNSRFCVCVPSIKSFFILRHKSITIVFTDFDRNFMALGVVLEILSLNRQAHPPLCSFALRHRQGPSAVPSGL